MSSESPFPLAESVKNSSIQDQHPPAQTMSAQLKPDDEVEAVRIPLSEITYNTQVDEYVHYSTSSELIPFDPEIHHERLLYDPAHWKIVPAELVYVEDGTCVTRPRTWETHNGGISCPVFKKRVTWCLPAEKLPMLHGFLKLPVELRRQIWKELLPYPRLISMYFCHGNFILDPMDNDGADFARASLGLLLTCRESREVYLENYDFLRRTNNEFWGFDSQYRVDSSNIRRCQTNKTYLDKGRDTIIFEIPDESNPEAGADLSLFDLSSLEHIAFHAPGSPVFTQSMLEFVSSLVARTRNLRSVNFVLGCMRFDTDEFWIGGRYQLLEVDSNFIDIPCQDASTDWSTTKRSRLGLLKWHLGLAENIRLSHAAFVQTEPAVWNGIKSSVSTVVKIKGPHYDNRQFHWLSLIPRDPKYSGVYFCTGVWLAEERTDSLHESLCALLDFRAECSFDGTMIPFYDNYTGIANMFDGTYGSEEERGQDPGDKLYEKLEGLIGFGKDQW